MKKLFFALFAIAIYTDSHGQTNPLLGQYIQIMPAYSPSLTGMNDYLDINMGFRQQWAGFNEAPQTNYLSAYGVIGAKKGGSMEEDGEETSATPSIKHGVGGFIMLEKQGFYKQTEISLAYAVHVPIFHGTYLSMGISPSIYNGKIDLSGVWVKDQVGDQTYQSLLNDGASNTSLHLNVGLSIYSSKYYISYGLMEATDVFLSGNKEMDNDKSSNRHHILGGYRFTIKDNIELIPNAFVRMDQTRPTFYEIGLRARYNQNLWAGVSYRNDKTMVGMLGISFMEKFKVGYAYEYKTADISNYSNGTHEIVLGIRFFNRSSFSAMW